MGGFIVLDCNPKTAGSIVQSFILREIGDCPIAGIEERVIYIRVV